MTYSSPSGSFRRSPDNMTTEQHNAFLAENAAKYPCPEGVTSYIDCTTKKDKDAFLRHKLATDLAWAAKGVVQIHKFQTESEKQSATTSDSNGIGWSGFDAKGMTYLAGWIHRATTQYGKNLSTAIDKPKSIRRVHKIMPKYAKQLMRIADKEVRVPE